MREYTDEINIYIELAQASLTHTLLALNAGLMRIISSCLCTPPNGGTGSSRCDKLARQSLLSLSQTSAAEAVSSLQALRERLTLFASSGDPRARISQKAVHGRTRKDELARRPRNQQATRRVKQQTRKETSVISAARTKNSNFHASQQRRKTETSKAKSVASEPVQGAWVRSKNHSSIYMATITSTKHHQQTANLKLRNKHASGKQIDGPDYSKYARLDMSGTDQAATSSNEPVGYYTADQLESHSERQSRSVGDATDKGQVEFPQCCNIRKDPPERSQGHNRISILSISSGSTKLGEIPQHKWAVPWVPPMESTEDDEYLDDELGNGISDARRKNAKTRLIFWKRFAKN